MSQANDPEAESQRRAAEMQRELEGLGPEEPSMFDQLGGDLQGKLKDAESRVLRAQAELENYRKRMRREMEDDRKYAILPVLRDVLNVVDNLNRAIEAAEQSENTGGLLEGVKMVATQLETALEQHQCKRIESLGQPFDPNLHEAIGQEPSNDYPQNSVTRELRAGYVLHDRVIRPSQVFISTGSGDPPPARSGGTK